MITAVQALGSGASDQRRASNVPLASIDLSRRADIDYVAVLASHETFKVDILQRLEPWRLPRRQPLRLGTTPCCRHHDRLPGLGPRRWLPYSRSLGHHYLPERSARHGKRIHAALRVTSAAPSQRLRYNAAIVLKGSGAASQSGGADRHRRGCRSPRRRSPRR